MQWEDPHHVVGEDAVQTVVMQGNLSVEALHLVSPHVAVNDYVETMRYRTNRVKMYETHS